jgi:predicted enzyme related to lactoylglutathione lyase
MFTGIKSVIYPSSDLERDKSYWTKITGVEPYFDQPYYVGFSINGCELGLDPNAEKEGITYPVSYWHVKDANAASDELTSQGVEVNSPLKDVGGGMMMATFKDANGNIFGIIDEAKESKTL